MSRSRKKESWQELRSICEKGYATRNIRNFYKLQSNMFHGERLDLDVIESILRAINKRKRVFW